MFEIIILAHVGQEDVYHGVGVVHSHPLGILQAHHFNRFLSSKHSHHVGDRVSNGLDLCRRLSCTDDEIAADGTFDITQVGNDDVASLLLLYSFFNTFY